MLLRGCRIELPSVPIRMEGANLCLGELSVWRRFRVMVVSSRVTLRSEED